MSRGKPCERMSRGAKGWHGFISCTKGWGTRGVWDVKPYLPRLSGRSTQQRRGVAAAPHDAPPSVKEGVGRFMTGRWGWLWYAWQRRCGRWRRGAGAGGRLGANQLALGAKLDRRLWGAQQRQPVRRRRGRARRRRGGTWGCDAHIISLHTCVSGHDAARGRETTLHTPRNDGVVSID